ncbi:MAG: hypothetical protein AAGA58_15740, partial [Verrucomicrobiota bacterium]
IPTIEHHSATLPNPESKVPDMSEKSDVHKLIRLKRYEEPGEEYFDKFLDEFKDRQRRELLNQSARGLLFERVQTWVNGLGKQSWVYGAGAAYAVLMLGFFMIPQEHDQANSGFSPVVSEPLLLMPNEVRGGEFDFDRIPGVKDGGMYFQPLGYTKERGLIELDASEPSVIQF